MSASPPPPDRPRRPTRADIIAPGFSTPMDSPLVPPFPFSFRNAEIMSVVYRTDPAAATALLPPPLELAGDVVMVHIYRMNDTDWLGAYGEANIMIPARLPGMKKAAGYSPWFFLDAPGGIAQGREVHGQPKKFARPRLRRRADIHLAQIVRDRVEVFTATMAYKQRRAAIADLKRWFDFSVNLNLKAIDHIDNRPAIRQLTARKLARVKVHECWRGACTAELRPHIQAPLWRLPVAEALEGFYWRADFTLVAGEIVHDYLARKPQSKRGKGGES
ncbi:MAG: acetoacetate decarboxylase [Gammaproteobacteria bacterium]|nr:acetoacetate decarboxylase [Gammaproteobacteria bacterium]